MKAINFRSIGLMTILVLAAACVGAHFYETAPIEERLTASYTKADGLARQADRDFSEKSSIDKGLDGTTKGEIQIELRRIFKTMHASINDVRQFHDQLKKERAGFSTAARGRKQISSVDNEWSDAAGSLQRFEDTMTAFNRALLEYSQATNSFTQAISAHKLYFLTDISQVQRRLNQVIQKNKKNLLVFDADIKDAEKLGAKNGHALASEKKSSIQAERNAYADRLQSLQKDANAMQALASHAKEISSVDPSWSEYQRLSTDAEVLAQEMAEISARLPKEIETFSDSDSK